MALKGKPRKLIKGVNDLATTHSEIATQADGWDPTTVIAGSEVVKEWLGSCGHIWKEQLKKRTGRGYTCPCCSHS